MSRFATQLATQFDMLMFPTIGVIIFAVVFGLIVNRVLRRSKEELDTLAAMPLSDGEEKHHV